MKNTKKAGQKVDLDKLKPHFASIKLAEVATPTATLQALDNQMEEWAKYGESNDYPTYLNSCQTKSTTHSAIVNFKKKLIVSEGLSYSDDIAYLLDEINDYDTATELLEQVADNIANLESFALKVTYNKTYNRILKVERVDTTFVRPALVRDKEGNILLDRIKGYYVCADWKNAQTTPYQYYPAFSTKNAIRDKSEQLFVWFRPQSGMPYLPQVSYESALHYIELQYELGKFSLNTVLNGFFASAIMKVKANMGEDERSEFEYKIKGAFSGAENASKLMVAISDSLDDVEIVPLSSGDNTALLQALQELCIAEICTAHQIQPILAGVQTAGSSLGSDGKMYRDSLEIYYNTTIRSYQKAFEDFLHKVLRFNGHSDYELEIASSALLANTLDIATKMDMLRPEIWMAEFGYTRDDIKAELLDELDEAGEENEENDVPETTGEDTDLPQIG